MYEISHLVEKEGGRISIWLRGRYVDERNVWANERTDMQNYDIDILLILAERYI